MPEELTMITDLLKKHKLLFQVVETPNHKSSLGRFKDHYTVFIPSKRHFSHLISFDDPFDGFRCARKGEIDTRYDTYADGLEEYVRVVASDLKKKTVNNGRKKKRAKYSSPIIYD